MTRLTCGIVVAALAGMAGPGAAQVSGAVDQGGAKAEEIRQVLQGIALPEGFEIDLYALVPGARQIAVSPDGGLVLVGSRRAEVWAVEDSDGDGIADSVGEFAPGAARKLPNGVCFAADGTAYVVELNRITAYPAAQETRAEIVAPEGELMPPGEESSSHGRHVCKVGPDDRIYVSLGQPYNVPPADKLELYEEQGVGGIIALNRDGSGREVYVRGLRNSVGHDFHPVTGDLWFTDNQVDGMGDDIPPGELNRATASGQHFGFPWYGGGDTRTEAYLGSQPPADAVFPVVETVAHAADLGMVFYEGTMFPEEYTHAIFSAQHGSWDRSEPVGARVMVTTFDAAGAATMVPFAEGWIDANGGYLGRPVDVAELPDGSLLVSDDHAGALYRITWSGAAPG